MSYANSWTLLNFKNLLHVLGKKIKHLTAQKNTSLCLQKGRVAYIYVASRASQLFSVKGWATLGLSPSSDLHHTNAAPKPLGKHQQTCHIQSAPERWLPFLFIWEPPGIQGFVHSLSYQMPIWSQGPCESGPSVWRWSALCCHLQWACSSSPSAGRKESKEDRPMNQKHHTNSSRKRGWDMTAFTRQGSKWILQVLKCVQSAFSKTQKTV